MIIMFFDTILNNFISIDSNFGKMQPNRKSLIEHQRTATI